MSRTTTVAAAFCLFLTLACAAAPPLRVEDEAGRVAAWSELDVAQVHAKAREVAARVAEVLAVPTQPFVIHVERGRGDFAGVFVARDRAGRVLDRRIELGEDALQRLDFALAHELVHWLVHGTTWDRLQLAVEEGLADHVALRLAPQWRAEREADLRGSAWIVHRHGWEALLALTKRNRGSASEELLSGTYVLGAFLVERVGLDGLRALCRRAEERGLADVPPGWILEAAGLDASNRDLELARWSAEPTGGGVAGPPVRARARFFDADGYVIATVAAVADALPVPTGATHVELSAPSGDWSTGRIPIPPGATHVSVTR